MLARGADVNIITDDQIPVIIVGAVQGTIEMLFLLLTHPDIDVDAFDRGTLVRSKTLSGNHFTTSIHSIFLMTDD